MANYKKKKNPKQKRAFHIVMVLLFVFLFFIWAYYTYQNITITKPEAQGDNQTPVRTSQTVEQIEQKSKQVEDVIEEVTQSVVGISKIKNNGSSIFKKEGTEQLGLGTGFLVSENGYIITNEHVSGARYSSCYVTLENGKIYNGNVVWSDSDIDLSIVKINMKNLPYAKLGDSEQLRVGQTVYAIGNPIGFEFQRTVTSGIISAKDRTLQFNENGTDIFMSDLIQTDAGINPGNSGGPLMNAEGYVVGINSVKITSAEGIGFAIPINIIKPIINQYSQTRKL